MAAVLASATADPGPPGWHGKLPALGDFVSRRLAPEFITPWDAWLSSGLQALRSAKPASWLQAYLESPSWRFLLQPGVLPGADTLGLTWAGVLMPSVDRVGRYFPLTLAQALPSAPVNLRQLQLLWQRLAMWDDLARDALHDDWTAEQLETALHQHHVAQGSLVLALAAMADADDADAFAAHPLPQRAGQTMPVAGANDAAQAMTDHLQLHAWHVAQGCSWWQAVPDVGPARLWLARGLPATLEPLFNDPMAADRS